MIDRAVLGSFERIGAYRPACEGLPGVQECPGPKQAPDVVGVHAAHHSRTSATIRTGPPEPSPRRAGLRAIVANADGVVPLGSQDAP